MATIAIEFDKTLQERLDEYKEIFLWSSEIGNEASTRQKRTTACLMKVFWGNHLSVVLYPKGWKAIWKVPKGKCLLMDLKYPSNVLVEVVSVDWDNLTADVQVSKINEHYVPSSKRTAALCELYPIEEQNVDHDPWLIANELDKYRFFNEYLWYPWDEIEDDINGWIESHLEQRIQLLYDMVIGDVNMEDSERMRYLISEAHHLQAQFEETGRALEELEESYDLNLNKDLEDLDELNANPQQTCLHEKTGMEKEEMLMLSLFLLKKQLKDIQYEFEALEDPVLRKTMENVKLRNHKRGCKMYSGEFPISSSNEGEEQEEDIRNVALVTDVSNFKEIRGYLDYAESKFSDGVKCSVEFFPSLQMAIDLVNSESTSYVVCPGLHYMKFTEDLLSPGTTITGFSDGMGSTPALIKGHSLGMSMIVVDWQEDQIVTDGKQERANLENLHFDPIGVEAVLLVDHGFISVTSCNFSHEESYNNLPVVGAHNNPSTSVLPRYSHHNSLWKEIQSGCEEIGVIPLPALPISAAFECPKQRGIAVGADGKLEAKDCHFKGLHLAIIAYSEAKVTLSNCQFSDCQVAIRISKGAEVNAERCIFERSSGSSILYCAGTHEEQNEETRKMMEGNEEIFTSFQILERIPGVTFKECIFVSGASKDVCLRSVGEIAKMQKPKETKSPPKEKSTEDIARKSLIILDETNDESVIILSDED